MGRKDQSPGERDMAPTVYVITQENCPNCPAAKMVVQEALAGTDVRVEIIDLNRMDPDFEFRLLEEQVFVASTPAVIVENNGSLRLLYSGEVPTPEGVRSAVEVHQS
ncbi:MAG: thioredoxin family protein [Candidatus Thorarchaeota archaeon]